MSAYKKIECQLANKELLLQSLRDLGLEPEEHKDAVKLAGSYGHERGNMSASITVPRQQIADVFGRGCHDLGFAWNEGQQTFDILCYDGDMYASQIHNRVKQAYSARAVMSALGAQRFSVTTVSGNLKQQARTKVNILASKVI